MTIDYFFWGQVVVAWILYIQVTALFNGFHQTLLHIAREISETNKHIKYYLKEIDGSLMRIETIMQDKVMDDD